MRRWPLAAGRGAAIVNAMVSKSVENTESQRTQSDRRLVSSVTLCFKD